MQSLVPFVLVAGVNTGFDLQFAENGDAVTRSTAGCAGAVASSCRTDGTRRGRLFEHLVAPHICARPVGHIGRLYL